MLIDDFAATVFVIKAQTRGLSHADSLRLPPFRGNCLNWVVGHIIKGRNEALQRLGAETVWEQATIDLYATGSDLEIARANALPLEQLLEDLDETQACLEAALQNASAEQLEARLQIGNQTVTVLNRLSGLHWHETYHAGQLELLRQLSGVDDQIF
jgi:hypothetical protein